MEELQMVALNEILKQQQQIIESQEEIKKELQAIRNSKEPISATGDVEIRQSRKTKLDLTKI
ncbi:hypothetical protein [Enterococcus hirae]|uniref:hypothetical protein n=1 Tax=Enterococcus hirae TaxID=1354 RepID=UPI001A96653C|nr:hypothetical protein [Enterococcus hirae]MBO1101365.1 hypothetical protein [Enterococcus hirae]